MNLFSEAETVALGEKIAKSLKSGAFIALTGDLGAGKTVFVKGLAQGAVGEDWTVEELTNLLNNDLD